MPVLCESCLINRQTISDLTAALVKSDLRVKEAQDYYELVKIKDKVIAHLKEQGAHLSPTNMIHAMFTLHYADWVDGEGIEPTCGYES